MNEDKEEVENKFKNHFGYDLSPQLLHFLSLEGTNDVFTSRTTLNWPYLGKLIMCTPFKSHLSNDSSQSQSSVLLKEEGTTTFAKIPEIPILQEILDKKYLCIKSKIFGNFSKYLCKLGRETSQLQHELLSILCDYRDLYWEECSFDKSCQLREAYCLHIVNHVLKSRLKILNHNARCFNLEGEIPDRFRDQGLVPAKVLILVPFRQGALDIVETISNILLSDEKPNVVHKKRFKDEFSGGELAQLSNHDEDFQKTFVGNLDDNFKIGIAVTKKSLKLYTDFYSSDIIIASPLALRVIIGAEGEKERDYDFLSSVEILILDQADIFLMQNWDHVLHVMNHINLQPNSVHGTDFSRVRQWAINGWSRFYRQTCIFSSHSSPDLSALANRKCRNYAGYARIVNSIEIGAMSQVVVRIPQVFHKIEGNLSACDVIDARFQVFVEKILPEYQDNTTGHTLIFVPSYFDFIRLRNYMQSEAVSFVQISEYTKDGKVAEARDKFFHKEANFLLYSERFHFYRRKRIKGVRHLIFYQLPTFARFYSEMCNLLQDVYQNPKSREHATSIIILYSKYDTPQLSAIVSTNRAARMLSSDKNTHMFMTE